MNIDMSVDASSMLGGHFYVYYVTVLTVQRRKIPMITLDGYEGKQAITDFHLLERAR